MKTSPALLLTLALATAGLAAPAAPVAAKPVIETGKYRNLFAELLGKTEAQTDAKLEAYWQSFFYGDADTKRLFYPIHDDMAYIPDVGNNDVRSEGMSYGMMICVQLNHQKEFNMLWKFAKTYMYHGEEGPMRGYFSWNTRYDGTQIGRGPAPDGEQWFTMALFFAAHRWGNGEGIFNYEAQAQEILHTMLHKEEFPDRGTQANMFDPATKIVRFVPDNGGSTNTDASYHLPAFYELWARWAAAPEDRAFMAEAAKVSRQVFKDTADPTTGLMANQIGIAAAVQGDRSGGGGRRGGAPAAAPRTGGPALPTLDALKKALSLTDTQAAAIAPTLEEITRAETGLATLSAINDTARPTGIAKILDLLAFDQKRQFAQSVSPGGNPGGGNGQFAEDAWRTLSYPALDWSWWGADPHEVEQSNRVLGFFARQTPYNWPYHFQLDGTPTLQNDDSPGLHAMAGAAGLAADPVIAKPFVQFLWDMPIPDDSDPHRDHVGGRGRAANQLRSHRYYDGLLGFLGMLEASGHFRIYAPPAAK